MNEDTLHLLSECAAGTDMAIRSLEDVLKNSAEARCKSACLTASASTSSLPAQAEDRLRRQGKEPKRADPAARAMSYLKTQAMLSMKPGDADDSRSHLDRLLDGHQVARPLLQPVPHSGRGRAGPRPVAHPAGGPAGQGYAAVSVKTKCSWQGTGFSPPGRMHRF